MKRPWMRRWLVGSLVGLAIAGTGQRAGAYKIEVVDARFTTKATARVGNDSDANVGTGSNLALSLAFAVGDTPAERFATSLSRSLNQSLVPQDIEIQGKIRTTTRLTASDRPGRQGPDEKATAGATGFISFTTSKSDPGEADDILLELSTSPAAPSGTFPFSYTVTNATSGNVLFDSANSGFGQVVFLTAKIGDSIHVDYSGYIEISGGDISRSLTSSLGVTVVPEPGTGLLACLGLATLGWARRRFEHRE